MAFTDRFRLGGMDRLRDPTCQINVGPHYIEAVYLGVLKGK